MSNRVKTDIMFGGSANKQLESKLVPDVIYTDKPKKAVSGRISESWYFSLKHTNKARLKAIHDKFKDDKFSFEGLGCDARGLYFIKDGVRSYIKEEDMSDELFHYFDVMKECKLPKDVIKLCIQAKEYIKAGGKSSLKKDEPKQNVTQKSDESVKSKSIRDYISSQNQKREVVSKPMDYSPVCDHQCNVKRKPWGEVSMPQVCKLSFKK